MSVSGDGTARRFLRSGSGDKSGSRVENRKPPATGTGKSRRAWCKTCACEGVDDLESEMAQPAKVHDPSRGEILASTGPIIPDDKARPPPVADKPAAAAPPPPPTPAKPAAPAAP